MFHISNKIVELVKDSEMKTLHTEAVGKIISYANNNGLLLSARIKGIVISFLTPLVITDEELPKGLSILEDAFATV